MQLLSKLFIRLVFISVILSSTVSAGFPPTYRQKSKQANFFPKPSPKYELSVCAIFQNEDRFLKEWVEFHLLVGVQHFYLFNNLSDDNYRKVLMPYVDAGIVELIEWPYASVGVVDWNEIQCNAYMQAVRTSRGQTRWLAILDTDEFLIPVCDNNLVNILSKYVKYGGVCANWQMYGTGGVAKVPDQSLMIEMLLMKAPQEYSENIHVKSIVQPMRVSNCKNPHHCLYKKDYYSVNTNKDVCPGPWNEPILTDKIRINHYWVRDEEFLHNVKIPRNVKWGGNTDGILARVNIMNQEYDPIMLRFTDKLRQRMGFNKFNKEIQFQKGIKHESRWSLR